MIVTKKISVDLVQMVVPHTVYAMQNDKASRQIALNLFENGVPWSPPAGVVAVASYQKPDGKGGIYDSLPDGTPAFEIIENVVIVTLAPQVCTVAGVVKFNVGFLKGNQEIYTFGIDLNVQPNPGTVADSEDFYKVSGFLPASGWLPNMYLATDENGNVIVKAGSGGSGTGKDGVTFFPSVDKDGNLSWSNNGGLENPETVNISGDPGERGLSMYLLNASLVGSAEYYSFSDFVIPEGYVPKLNDLVLYRSGHLGYIHEVNMELESALVALIPGANLSGQPGEKGVQGEPGAKGSPGENGKDGTSVTVKSVSESTADGGSNVINFSDGKTVTIKNGSKGSDGASPTIEIEETESGVLIEAINPDGTQRIGYVKHGRSPSVLIYPTVSGNRVVFSTENGSEEMLVKHGIDGDPGKDGSNGQNGKDGTSVTVKSVSESTADGGSNVITFSDGKTVTIKNGSKGSAGTNGTNGKDGKTPVKGTDYWTPADQEAIVQQVIAALGTPVFGRVDADKKITLSTEHLADGTYYLGYEDKDGNWVEIGTISTIETSGEIPLNLTLGKIDTNTGSISSSENYTYSDMVAIEPGKTYTFSATNVCIIVKACYYDASGSYLSTSGELFSGSSETLASTSFVIPIITGASYFRMRVYCLYYNGGYAPSVELAKKNSKLTWTY